MNGPIVLCIFYCYFPVALSFGGRWRNGITDHLILSSVNSFGDRLVSFIAGKQRTRIF